MAKKILFTAIIVIGLFLRIYQVDRLPAGLFMDEVNIAIDAKTLVQNGTDQYGRHLPFGFEDVTDYKLPVYIYFTTFFFKLLGVSTLTVRMTAICASIASIFLLGYLTKLLFPEKKKLPFYSMSVIALSPFAVHMGRIGYETMLATCFFIVYLIALIKVLHNKSIVLWIILGGLAIIICDWTYPGPRFTIPAFTFLLLISLFFSSNKNITRHTVITSALFFIFIIVTFIPSLLFPFLDKRPLSYLAEGSRPGTIMQFIGDKFFSSLSAWIRLWDLEFLFDKGDLFAYRAGTKEIGIYLSIFVIPFLLGILYFIKTFSLKSFPYLFILLLTITAGLPSALTANTPYSTRFLPMIIPFTILIGLGIEQLFVFLSTKKKIIKNTVYSLLFLLLSYQIALFTHIYFVHFAITSLPEFSKAPVTLATYLKKEMAVHPQKKIYFLNNVSCHQWGNDELHLWYYANLDNAHMITWNLMFRSKRYQHGSPFDAYDLPIIPRYSFDNIIIAAGYSEMGSAPSGSLLIHCGYQLAHIDQSKEIIKKIIYMYDDVQRDPFYIIGEKR